MAEETTKTTEEMTETPAAESGETNEDGKSTEKTSWTHDEVQNLIAKAAEAEKLREKLDEKNKADELAKAKRLEEDGKFKELAQSEREKREQAEAKLKQTERNNAIGYEAMTAKLEYPLKAVLEIAPSVDDGEMPAADVVKKAQAKLRDMGLKASETPVAIIGDDTGSPDSRTTGGDSRIKKLAELHKRGQSGDRSAQNEFAVLQSQLRREGVKLPRMSEAA